MDYVFPRTIEAETFKNMVWLKIDSRKINISENVSAHPRVKIPTTQGEHSFQLLMPDNFNISLSHNWEVYDSVTSRLAETLSRLYKTIRTIGGIGSALYKTGSLTLQDIAKTLAGQGSNMSNILASSFSNIANSENIVFTRADSPLVYKSSQPLEYNIVFEFVVRQSGDAEHINDMIRELMKLSSPRKNPKWYYIIEPPHLFSVKTICSSDLSDNTSEDSSKKRPPMLNIEYAALTTVQPEFKAPYINGRPMATSLTLTFVDVTPLFDETFITGTSVTTEAVVSTPQKSPEAEKFEPAG